MTGGSGGSSLIEFFGSLVAAFLPGVFHDGLWRGYAEVLENGRWVRKIPDFKESTEMFREALINNRMGVTEAGLMYDAIMLAGGDARLGDMAMAIPTLPHDIPEPLQPDQFIFTE